MQKSLRQGYKCTKLDPAIRGGERSPGEVPAPQGRAHLSRFQPLAATATKLPRALVQLTVREDPGAPARALAATPSPRGW